MYLENYNIPCIISGSPFKGRIDSLCCSKDIPVVLTFLADGVIPSSFSGKLILDGGSHYQHLFIEYCGGGCPDLSRRDLKIGCFNKKWFVASETKLDISVNETNITEIYNLEEDPLQLHNLKNKTYDKENVLELIRHINARKDAIKKTLK